jgi:hypothetical protein
VNIRLTRLALRRALAPGVVAAWILLAILLLSRDWAGENALLEAVGEGADSGGFARGLLREGAWTFLAIGMLPLLVLSAARTVSVWRAGELEWLASRGSSRGTILVSTWIGTWAGGAALLAISCLSIELRGEPGASACGSFRRASGLVLASAPPGSRARIEIGLVSSAGSAAEVVLRARRGREERKSRVRVSSGGAIEVDIPPGAGPVALELACAEPGANAVVAAGVVEVWVPCTSDRAAGAEILLRILVALAGWSALALGLGAWVSPPIAVAAILAAWIPAWLGGSRPVWLPGADLWDAIRIAGMGRVPEALDPRVFAGGALLAAVGLALAAAGFAGRRSPA